VAGLATGRFELLGRLTVDRLHEPYRAIAYPQLPQMVAAAREAGALGACLSGAGSTIIAFTDSGAVAAALERALTAAAAEGKLTGRVRTVELRNAGAQVVARA
jgi:homoserine kinase